MTTSEFLAGAFDGYPVWRKFCAEFGTMREVWLSDSTPPGLMLWALGQNWRNKLGVLIEYAEKFCGARITGFELHHVPVWWRIAHDAFDARELEAGDPKRTMSYGEFLSRVRAINQAHRDELRRLFPGPFIFGVDGFHPPPPQTLGPEGFA